MSNELFVLESSFAKHRDQFSEEEKGQLQRAVVGEVICPRGWMIDTAKLPDELAAKIRGVA